MSKGLGTVALESWHWFIELARKGNFTRAAEELGISQQTLSARLASLERELDAKLIVRSTPLTLTPAGTEFLSYASEQEQARTELVRRVGEASSGGAGVLKVAIGNMRAWAMMPAVITEFHKGLPGVRIELIEGTNEDLLRMAERGDAAREAEGENTRADRMFERMMMGLRQVRGVDAARFERDFGEPIARVWPAAVAEMTRGGLMARNKERIFLTSRGMQVMNGILVRLMEEMDSKPQNGA